MKFKVGDKVIVRKDLEVDRYYGKAWMHPDMKKYIGCEITINGFNDMGMYTMANDIWSWTNEMFEPQRRLRVGDKVKICEGTSNPSRIGRTGIVSEILTSNQTLNKSYINLKADSWTYCEQFLKLIEENNMEQRFNYKLQNGVNLELLATDKGFTLWTSIQHIIDASRLIEDNSMRLYDPEFNYRDVTLSLDNRTLTIEKKKVLPTEQFAKTVGYDTTIVGDRLKVGCKEIPLTLLEEVVKQMKESK